MTGVGTSNGPASSGDQANLTPGAVSGSWHPVVPLPEPLPEPVTDSHTHLDLARDAIPPAPVVEALRLAASVNVTRVVQVGVDVGHSRDCVAMAGAHEAVAAGVAIHPNEAARLGAAGELDLALSEIATLATAPGVVAVGETGLDRFRTGPEGWERQERSFRAHVDIAREQGKALVIHDRDAHQAVLDVLGSMPLPDRVVFHCFSGDAELAQTCAERGWFVSFAGTVTFRNAAGLRRAVAVTPPSRLLVETDSPYLTPHPFRGKVNSSYLVPWTVRAVAAVQDRPLHQVCRDIATATEAAFGTW